MSPAAVTNGDSPTTPTSSAFLNHLASYPLISDSIQTIQTNPYTSKTLAISRQTYTLLTEKTPIIPLLSKPYQYAAPYLSRADQVGDNTLSTIDEKFPVVKKPTGELYNEGKSVVFFPLVKGKEGKEYVFDVYGREMGKFKGQGKNGLVEMGRAAVVTGLLVTGDVVAWLGRFLKEKKAETKEVVNEKM